MFRFHKTYLLFSLLLFITEVLIALFLDDRFVRPYAGDFLVVILLYCFLRGFLNASRTKLAVAVLLFACVIEAAQYVHVLNYLGAEHNRIVRTVLGSSAEWSDVLAYALGVAAVLLIDRKPAYHNRGELQRKNRYVS